MSVSTPTLDRYADFFLPKYHNYPQGRYISLLLVRQVASEAIFRTEGSGEGLNKETVYAGLQDNTPIRRVVISKRKQTAVERRTGRELLRAFHLLFKPPKGEADEFCALNRNNPCEKCMDCMIYGYAAGGGGAQRARVITDDAFSLHPAHVITDTKQFNALYDNSTMRDPETGKPSTSIGTDEYVKPESVFLDIETLHDLTRDEWVYVLGNILRSSRYGAISSRIGKINNLVAGIILSDCEIFSNLELTQAVYDDLRGQADELDFPLRGSGVQASAAQMGRRLAAGVAGRVQVLELEEVQGLVRDVAAIYQHEATLSAILERASSMYG